MPIRYKPLLRFMGAVWQPLGPWPMLIFLGCMAPFVRPIASLVERYRRGREARAGFFREEECACRASGEVA
jgi:hypothetical protein